MAERPLSKIQQMFDRQGRELFEYEKPIVAAFNAKYERLIAEQKADREEELLKRQLSKPDPFPFLTPNSMDQ